MEYFERYSRLFRVLAFAGYYNKRKRKWEKHPLNTKYKDVPKEVVNKETYTLIKNRKTTAIAIIPGDGGYICVDIDYYKMIDEEKKRYWEIIQSLRDKTYIEKTPSGGFHIFFKKPKLSVEYGSDHPDIEIRENAPATVYPSRFYDAKYLRISRVQYVDQSMELTPELMEIFQIHEVDPSKKVKFGNIKINLENIKVDGDALENCEDPIDFLIKYAEFLNCPGFKIAMQSWKNTGKIPVPQYRIPKEFVNPSRGSHWLTEMIIFGMLYYLGLPPEKFIEVAKKIDYIDGISQSSPLHLLKYTILKGNLPIPRICPFKHLCPNSLCSTNPYYKMSTKDKYKFWAREICKRLDLLKV